MAVAGGLCASLQGYKVFYTNMPNLPMRLWTIHRVEGNSKLTTIGELQPNKTYTVSVLAYNSVGDGPRSEKKQVMTRQGGEYTPARTPAHCADSSSSCRTTVLHPHIRSYNIQSLHRHAHC